MYLPIAYGNLGKGKLRECIKIENKSILKEKFKRKIQRFREKVFEVRSKNDRKPSISAFQTMVYEGIHE